MSPSATVGTRGGLGGLLDLPAGADARWERSGGSAPYRRDLRTCVSGAAGRPRGVVRIVAEQHREQALVPGRHIVPVESAFAFAGPALAEAEQTAQAGIGGAIRRVDEKRRAVRRDRAGSRPRGARRSPSTPHRPARCRPANCGRRSPSAGMPSSFACSNNSRRARCAAQEREMRRDLKLGILVMQRTRASTSARPRSVGASRKSQKRAPCLVLDAVIIAQTRNASLFASPPFARDALRPVGPDHPVADVAPDEKSRRMIGQQGGGRHQFRVDRADAPAAAGISASLSAGWTREPESVSPSVRAHGSRPG